MPCGGGGFFVGDTNTDAKSKPLWERACSRRRYASWRLCRLTHRLREQARSHRGLCASRATIKSPCNRKGCRGFSLSFQVTGRQACSGAC
ncbi:hypothetical protein C0J56_06370 [Pseudomonas fluorescens]|nr:hypothetical protein C0J56_06370 [Pseudomonas fluorescens]